MEFFDKKDLAKLAKQLEKEIKKLLEKYIKSKTPIYEKII